jgi:putative transcriptional regulator
MKLSAQVMNVFGAVLVLIACTTDAVHAADLSQPVTLVATSRLAGSIYEETVLVAAPLPQGQHVGFILNRPTRIKLETLFPGHSPSRKVVEPLSVGGPMLSDTIVALTRKAPRKAAVIALMPGLVAVTDGKSVDRVIETMPNDARYFAGLMLWAPGELDREIRSGAWNLRPASVDMVFSPNTAGLWKELSGGARWIQVINESPATRSSRPRARS